MEVKLWENHKAFVFKLKREGYYLMLCAFKSWPVRLSWSRLRHALFPFGVPRGSVLPWVCTRTEMTAGPFLERIMPHLRGFYEYCNPRLGFFPTGEPATWPYGNQTREAMKEAK